MTKEELQELKNRFVLLQKAFEPYKSFPDDATVIVHKHDYVKLLDLAECELKRREDDIISQDEFNKRIDEEHEKAHGTNAMVAVSMLIKAVESLLKYRDMVGIGLNICYMPVNPSWQGDFDDAKEAIAKARELIEKNERPEREKSNG